MTHYTKRTVTSAGYVLLIWTCEKLQKHQQKCSDKRAINTYGDNLYVKIDTVVK